MDVSKAFRSNVKLYFIKKITKDRIPQNKTFAFANDFFVFCFSFFCKGLRFSWVGMFTYTQWMTNNKVQFAPVSSFFLPTLNTHYQLSLYRHHLTLIKLDYDSSEPFIYFFQTLIKVFESNRQECHSLGASVFQFGCDRWQMLLYVLTPSDQEIQGRRGCFEWVRVKGEF